MVRKINPKHGLRRTAEGGRSSPAIVRLSESKLRPGQGLKRAGEGMNS